MDIKTAVFFLENLAGEDTDLIESDAHEFYGEDENGNGVTCTVKITDIAQVAVNYIRSLESERDKAQSSLDTLSTRFTALIQQNSALAAENERLSEKLAAMESQTPAATVKEWNKGGSGEFKELIGIDKLEDGQVLYSKPVPADKPAVAVPDDVYEALANELWELGLDTKPGYAPQLGEVYEILDKHLAIAPSHSQQSAEVPPCNSGK